MSIYKTESKDEVLIEQQDNIYYLILNKQQNEFNLDFIRKINEKLDIIEKGPQGQVMITVSTSERIFSVGMDIPSIKRYTYDQNIQLIREISNLCGRLLHFPKPSIALINGHALGAGLMFVMCHDYRIMREDKGYIGLPEIKLGSPIPPGLLATVQAKIPLTLLKNLASTGEFITSKQALQYRIVDQLSSADTLIEDAKNSIEQFEYAAYNTEQFIQIKTEMYAYEYDQLTNRQLDDYTHTYFKLLAQKSKTLPKL